MLLPASSICSQQVTASNRWSIISALSRSDFRVAELVKSSELASKCKGSLDDFRYAKPEN